jgi:hypothetical protein
MKMPDGDVIRYGVGSKFTRVYEEICDMATDDDYSYIVDRVAQVTCQTLKLYGNEPIQLMKRVYQEITIALENGEILSPSQMSYWIDNIARNLMGHKYGISIGVDTCKEITMMLANGEGLNFSNKVFIRRYIERVLDANFYESMPLNVHYHDADPFDIEQRIQNIRPLLNEYIEDSVSKIIKDGTVDKLTKKRKPRNFNPNFSDMDLS